MGKIIFLASAIAAVLLATVGVSNAAQPFLPGWNKVVATNCLFLPGNPLATPPVPDMVDIFVQEVVVVTPPVPPAIPSEGEFDTSDPIAISLIAPYCKDGTPFFFWWDAVKQKAIYFSIYPGLT